MEGHLAAPTGVVVSDWQASYLDYVTKNVARLFISRWLTCRGLFRNRDWIATVENGGCQFRCPLCGEQFKANAIGDHFAPAAIVIAMVLM